ncbi:MAG: protease inhibitor I42 family protein [Chloroflexi bacterium]|nr:protease inhibitor I42 family protein [Chloroflexota bacterium]
MIEPANDEDCAGIPIDPKDEDQMTMTWRPARTFVLLLGALLALGGGSALAQTGTPAPTVPPAGAFVSPPVFSSGEPSFAFVVFTGGTVAQLEGALRSVGATGAWAQSASGAFVLYIVSGPAFVNAPAVAAVPGNFERMTALTLVKGGDDRPDEIQLTQADNGATVRLAQGGTLLVALPSNPSTGYRWWVAEGSGAALELIDVRYVPPGSTMPVVGAAGTEVFRFRAVAPGVTSLVLDYARGFEPGVPATSTFTVSVHIR